MVGTHDISQSCIGLANEFRILLAVFIKNFDPDWLFHLEIVAEGDFLFPVGVDSIALGLSSADKLDVPMVTFLHGESEVGVRFGEEIKIFEVSPSKKELNRH